jgi:DNA repair protein RadB
MHLKDETTDLSMARKLSSGVDFIDALLDGGYERDAITTIYGPAGAGKTNLAVLAAVHAAKKGKKVVFIDTEGGFSVTRLKQLCVDHKKVLQNVIFLNPTSFDEQKRAFEKLPSLISKKISLIIIDTICMLYRFDKKQGDTIFEHNRDLSAQIAKLTEITRKSKVPVLMTNQIYTSFRDGGMKMVGGDVLTYGSKCLLELHLRGSHRRLILKKHRSIAAGKSCDFRIIETGLEQISSQ